MLIFRCRHTNTSTTFFFSYYAAKKCPRRRCCPFRYADAPRITEILQGVKAALKDVPNVDLLSPFRVHLVDFAETGLKITIVCYFATKSFDEFLYLQQLALLEVTRVVQSAGATMTSVMHVDMSDPTPIPASKLQAVLPQAAMAPQPPTQERDGLATVFEEQDTAIKINGSVEDAGSAASASVVSRPNSA